MCAKGIKVYTCMLLGRRCGAILGERLLHYKEFKEYHISPDVNEDDSQDDSQRLISAFFLVYTRCASVAYTSRISCLLLSSQKAREYTKRRRLLHGFIFII